MNKAQRVVLDEVSSQVMNTLSEIPEDEDTVAIDADLLADICNVFLFLYHSVLDNQVVPASFALKRQSDPRYH